MRVTNDRFYTKPEIATMCYDNLIPVLQDLKYNLDHVTFIEPSVGKGAFWNLLPKDRRIGVEIDDILDYGGNFFFKTDYLETNLSYSKNNVVIGNPPFGKYSKTAIDFLNKSAIAADTVGFILQLQFARHIIQQYVADDMKLVASYSLPKDAFYTHDNTPYNLKTKFFIWSRLPYKNGYDERIHIKPPIAHQDFTMWRYNNTKKSLYRFVDKKFDLAVMCQGYNDEKSYSRRETSVFNCETNKQWLTFKVAEKNNDFKKIVLNRLHKIDYFKLARADRSFQPGFGKNEVVAEYVRLKKVNKI